MAYLRKQGENHLIQGNVWCIRTPLFVSLHTFVVMAQQPSLIQYLCFYKTNHERMAKPLPYLGALIFRDHGKRTENTEMAFGNGKCNFKRKITENHFSAGKNNKIHKIYKISQTKWIYFHATLPRIRVYIYNTHLYVNGISNILYVQSLWENGISIFPPYWNGIEDFQKRKRQFFETENQCP